MFYKLEFRKRALNQMQKSYDYYESKKEGLGESFVEEIELYLSKINSNPKHFQVKRKEIREAYLKKFPFAIVFSNF